MVTALAYYGDQAVGGDDGEHGGEDDGGGARVNRLERLPLRRVVLASHAGW